MLSLDNPPSIFSFLHLIYQILDNYLIYGLKDELVMVGILILRQKMSVIAKSASILGKEVCKEVRGNLESN